MFLKTIQSTPIISVSIITICKCLFHYLKKKVSFNCKNSISKNSEQKTKRPRISLNYSFGNRLSHAFLKEYFSRGPDIFLELSYLRNHGGKSPFNT